MAPLSQLRVGDRSYGIFRLAELQASYDVARLPYTLRVLLENVLRNGDDADVEAVARWDAKAEPANEIAFSPSRVLMAEMPCGRVSRGLFHRFPGRRNRNCTSEPSSVRAGRTVCVTIGNGSVVAARAGVVITSASSTTIQSKSSPWTWRKCSMRRTSPTGRQEGIGRETL